MRHSRIAVVALAVAAVAALGACRQQAGPEEAANRAATGNASILTAPAPTPTPTPTPPAMPSPRSIMQPSINPEPIAPPPLQPLDATIGFPDGGARLDDAAKGKLDTLAAGAVMASGGPIVLRGSSDSHGSDADNMAMSKKRAEAVAHYLEGKGVAKDRIMVIALGEGRPAEPNVNLDGSDNPAGRAANRRVDIHITPATPPSDQPTEAPAPPPAATGNRAAPAP